MIGSELILAEIIRQSLDGRCQVFTANGSFTVPPGITRLFITATAAGNAGSPGSPGSNGTDSSGGTGGAGGKGGSAGQRVINFPITVTPGEVIPVTVGAGNTVFGSYLTLIKGGGQAGGNGGEGGSGGSGGSSNGGFGPLGGRTCDALGNGEKGQIYHDYAYGNGGAGGKGGSGADGLFSLNLPGGGPAGGNGGNGPTNALGIYPGSNGTSAHPTNYGAGGGGGGGGGGGYKASTNIGAGGAGGAGAPGILIVRW